MPVAAMKVFVRLALAIVSMSALSGCVAPLMMAPAMLPAMMPSLGLMTAATAGNSALQQAAAGGGLEGLGLPAAGPQKIEVRQSATSRQRQVALSRARAAEAGLRRSGDKKMPEFLAVDTVAAAQNPDGTMQIMVYDTTTRSLAGDEIYNFRRAPKLGAKQTVGAFRALYVGSGEGA